MSNGRDSIYYYFFLINTNRSVLIFLHQEPLCSLDDWRIRTHEGHRVLLDLITVEQRTPTKDTIRFSFNSTTHLKLFKHFLPNNSKHKHTTHVCNSLRCSTAISRFFGGITQPKPCSNVKLLLWVHLVPLKCGAWWIVMWCRRYRRLASSSYGESACECLGVSCD